MPITLRLAPGGNSFIAELPVGRVMEVRADLEGLDLLLGVLRRADGTPTPLEPQAKCKWPPGLVVRFAPPHGSFWRGTKIFEGDPDYVEGKVKSETRAGTIQVEFPNGTFAVHPKHLQVAGTGRRFDSKGKPPPPTLEDLGLA